jgi:hypothetical protein
MWRPCHTRHAWRRAERVEQRVTARHVVERSAGYDSSHVMAATIEAPFVFTASHFGFLIGPTADIGVSGTADQKITQLGAQAGLVGWF